MRTFSFECDTLAAPTRSPRMPFPTNTSLSNHAQAGHDDGSLNMAGLFLGLNRPMAQATSFITQLFYGQGLNASQSRGSERSLHAMRRP
ncbi:hypothetical protein [Saccharibacter floricola]|uniref:hypothetical protein n=1 Tax=Saccharibacter floricola TaxID=231053 RepID=UPI00035C0BA8|nr:hypothetical protein [Saccharibacter floricola]